MPLEYPHSRRHRRPGDRDAETADATEEHQPHARITSAFEANALQGHSHLHRVASVSEASRRVPQPVGREILVPSGAVERIHLDAAWIDKHVIGELTGAEGVETRQTRCRVGLPMF